MSFRRTSNAHECWLTVVRENSDLLGEIPASALENEQTFLDYVTSGVNRGNVMSPGIPQLSDQAIENLSTFIHHKAQFDMDAVRFDGFNAEYRRRHLHPLSAVTSKN